MEAIPVGNGRLFTGEKIAADEASSDKRNSSIRVAAAGVDNRDNLLANGIPRYKKFSPEPILIIEYRVLCIK